MKKIESMLRRCKTLSRQLVRTSSYSSLRSSKSTRDNCYQNSDAKTIFVGSSRRQYLIGSKYLNHPLLSALIEKSRDGCDDCDDHDLSVKCEVVLFDHFLWMLDNADLDVGAGSSESLEELANLYVY